METLIISLIPSIQQYPTLLILCQVIFTLFFGSFVYSFIFSLFGGYKNW